MTSSFELNATARTETGTGMARRLRKDNKVPAVLYGGASEAKLLELEHHKLARFLEDEAVYSHILDLKIDGKSEKVILKGIQRHPSKEQIMHMDLLRVSKNEKLRVHVPLHFINEELSPGVKEGGIVMHNMVEIEVSCLPADLPEFLEADLSGLEMDASIHLSDIKVPDGAEIVELTHGEDHNLPVAVIKMARAQVEETAIESSASEDSGEPSSEDSGEKSE